MPVRLNLGLECIAMVADALQIEHDGRVSGVHHALRANLIRSHFLPDSVAVWRSGFNFQKI